MNIGNRPPLKSITKKDIDTWWKSLGFEHQREIAFEMWEFGDD